MTIPMPAPLEGAEAAVAKARAGEATRLETIAARLDRLPSAAPIWRLVVLLSLGGFFEYYELFSTAYVLPDIISSGILAATTSSVLAMNSVGAYIAATFIGLFIGTMAFGFIADKLGRNAVFTYSLLWYSGCAVAMAFQDSSGWLNFWRLMTGIGLGVELVTIDAYLSELVPAHMRGKAFALNQVISFAAVPTVAFASYLLIGSNITGGHGWRWVIAVGATGSLIVWFIRLRLPESPRWLAGKGRLQEADRIVSQIEADVLASGAATLRAPAPVPTAPIKERGRFRDLWSREYAPRTVMLMVFHVAQTIGLYGFSQWVPVLLSKQGIPIGTSLGYGVFITAVTPFGPLLALLFADRVERKWQIACAALLACAAGLAFANSREPAAIICFGMLVSLSATIISLNFHAYQAELFPTRVRALAIGFVYSMSRLSGIASGFLISYTLAHKGAPAALTLIACCMGIVAVTVGGFGPRTRGRSLEEINAH